MRIIRCLLVALALAGCMPANSVSVAPFEFVDGRFSATVPFLSNKRGVYDLYLINGQWGSLSPPLPISGDYEVRNDSGEAIFEWQFKEATCADERLLLSAFTFTKGEAVDAKWLTVRIDIEDEDLASIVTGASLELEKRGYPLLLD